MECNRLVLGFFFSLYIFSYVIQPMKIITYFMVTMMMTKKRLNGFTYILELVY